MNAYDLKVLTAAIDNASYGRTLQKVDSLEEVAFCRAPVVIFPDHKFIFSITTANGTNARILRKTDTENPELNFADNLEILAELVMKTHDYNMCEVDEFEDIAYSRTLNETVDGYTFLFRMHEPQRGKEACVFQRHDA